MSRIDSGRNDLAAWLDAQPENFYLDDPLLRDCIRRLLPAEELDDMEERLAAFGAECAGSLDRAVELNNRPHNLPRLERYDGIGRRLEEVEHHPSFHEAGAIIYGSGMMGEYAKPGGFLRSLSLFSLSSKCGEAGHNCPVACTAGVVQSVAALGSPDLKSRFMERLYSADYWEKLDGAQFLTEVQGGSDVGANSTWAKKDEHGNWRIYGEKWFCSNANADLIVMTARVDDGHGGTKGLGLFLVPRQLENGDINAFYLRRLKDKLGTRSMASGELDFDGAFAWALGETEEGFRNMMRFVISVSRIYNGVAVAGIARRAWHIAKGYAEHRRAFGQPIIDYEIVRYDIEELEAISSTIMMASLDLTQWMDKSRAGELNEAEEAFLRTAVNLHKRRSSMSATECALKGIEILGGNGAIESFSIMPRLLRDAIVCENWEGTHNTLIAQVLRDMHRYQMHEPYLQVLALRLNALSSEHTADFRERLAQRLDEASEQLRDILAQDPNKAALAMRRASDTLTWLYYSLIWCEHIEALDSDSKIKAALLELANFERARGL